MLTIVVIEEDLSMRTLVREWLGLAGYRVLDHRETVGPARGVVDLVIVDLLDIPNRGAETLRQVRASYPDAEVIGMSTQLRRSFREDSMQVRTLRVRALVAKPCRREELLAAVAAVIPSGR